MVELVWKEALVIPAALVGLVLAMLHVADWMHFVVLMARPVVRLCRALRDRRP